jgi:hypothetical protein
MGKSIQSTTAGRGETNLPDNHLDRILLDVVLEQTLSPKEFGAKL